MGLGLKRTENSNKFRKAALHFQKNECYTFAPPGTTEYIKYWTQEREYCLYGYTAEDGDRIPGFFYFYLNYFRIGLVHLMPYTLPDGTVENRPIHMKDLPDFYDYDRFFFEAVEQCELQGKHMVVLKARRKGYSYKVASMLIRNYYFIKGSKGFALASEAEYLVKDGILSKAWDGMDFIDSETAWYKKRQKADTRMHRKASFVQKDDTGVPVELGYKSEIMGVTLKNDPSKARGKCFGRNTEILMADGSINMIQNIKIGDQVMGPDGNPRRVYSIHSGIDDLYKITPANGKVQIVNSKHDIYYDFLDSAFKKKKSMLIKPIEYINFSKTFKSRSKLVKTGVDFKYQKVLLDPYYLGLWLGDGSKRSTCITNEDFEILEYVKKFSVKEGCKYNAYVKKNNSNVIEITITGGSVGLKRNKIKNKLVELNVLYNKHIPSSYLINSREVRLTLLAGLIDTDGYYDVANGRFEIIQKLKNLSNDIVYLSRSLGFKTSINEKYIEGYGIYYRINILSGIEEIPTLVERKQAIKHIKPFVLNPLHSTFKVEKYSKGEYFGFTVDQDHLFLLGDFTICHNSGKLIVFEECFGEGTKILDAQFVPKRIEDIKIGDEVLNKFGYPAVVAETHVGVGNLYIVKQKYGDDYVVSENHMLRLQWGRNDYVPKCIKTNDEREYVISVRDYLKLPKYIKQESYGIKHGGFEFYDSESVPLPPYLLGYWLGDGDKTRPSICTNDQEIIHHFTEHMASVNPAYEYQIRDLNYTTAKIINFKTYEEGNSRNLFQVVLEENNLIGNKHIPQIYKTSSVQTRLKLLAGFIDADGYKCVSKGGETKYYEVIHKKGPLLNDIKFLSESLGFRTVLSTKKVLYKGNLREYGRLRIIGKVYNIPIKIERKKIQPFIRQTRLHTSPLTIEYLKEGRHYGFTLETVSDDDDARTILLSDLTVTQNSGKFPGLLDAWQITRPSVEQGSHVHGTMLAFGTGGTEDANYEGLKELFENPDGYNCMVFQNIWDDHLYGQECGFFIPQYANLEGEHPETKEAFMDGDGNTNVVIAKRYILEERQKVIDNASDRRAIDRHIAEQPITPAEATLNISSNIFPKAELQRHLATIKNSDKFKEYKQVGNLMFDETGSIKWEINTKYRDIIKYRLKPEDSREGAIVIWEHPIENPPYGLYVMGADSYDHDQSGTDSLGSVFVYKRFQGFESFYDMPVAEYTGRPNTAEEFYEKVRMLALYYNAKIMYENEKKGLFSHFSHKHQEYLLADQPDILKDVVQDMRVQRGKGCHMNTPIKVWGEGLIKDWLNEEYAAGKKNLTKVFSEALLEELISYNPDGNFDRVMAFMQVMIYREELHHVRITEAKEKNKIELFSGGIFRIDKQAII